MLRKLGVRKFSPGHVSNTGRSRTWSKYDLLQSQSSFHLIMVRSQRLTLPHLWAHERKEGQREQNPRAVPMERQLGSHPLLGKSKANK